MDQAINPDEAFAQLRIQLVQSARRLEMLETEVEHEALVITQSQSNEQEFVEEITANIESIGLEHEALGAEIKLFLREVNTLSERFRHVVKKDSFESLQRRVDAWRLEELMTKNEFERALAKKVISSRL